MSQKIKTSVEIDGSLTASQIANATTDTDKFLVSDGGTVKYRTGAELASDLGIASGSTSKVQHQVKAGVAINKGQAVYVTSADGTNMIVGLASNASEATSSKTMGLLNATVVANGFADVVTEGLLDGLDTSTATIGNPVWLGTNGNLIYGLANKPSAPNHLVFIGIVTRVNANNGEIFVKVQNGFELDEIHDVDLKTTTKVNGHLLGYNGSLWVNKTIAEWLGYTPYNASNPAGYISSYTETDTLASVTARGALTNTPIAISAGTLNHVALADRFNLIGGSNFHITNNAYYDSGFKYKFADLATKLALQADGILSYQTAVTGTIGAAVTFDTKFSVDSSGNLIVPGTLTASGYNKTNWDTAFGWGNHASAGYVPTSRTITINGTSYDLSANRSWTVTASETDTLATVTARGNSTSSPISVNSVTTTASTQANATLGTIASSWGGISYPTLYGSATDRWVMHINPHISYTQNGVNGFTGSMVGSTVRMASDTIATHYWDIGVGTNNVGIDRFSIGRNATNFLSINNSGNVISSIDMRSPIFYDSSDTGYYWNPAADASHRFQTPYGYIDIGPKNTSYCHIYTDRPSFYFNQTLLVNGNTVWHGGNDGSGSGLDADLIDGIESSRIVYGGGASKINSHANANEQRDSGFYENDGGGSNWPSGTWYNSINVRHSNQGNYHGFQVAMSYYDNNLWFRSYQGAGTFQSWQKAAVSRGEGSNYVDYSRYVYNNGAYSGSGWVEPSDLGVRYALNSTNAGNADTVDGYHGNTFYRNLGFGSGYPSWNLNTVDPDRSGFTYSNGGPWTGPFIHIGASGYGLQFNASYGGNGTGISYRTRNGDTGSWNSWFRMYSDTYRPYADDSGTTGQRSFNYLYASSYLESGGAVYGTIFYDNNNRGYYMDPDGTSQLSSIYTNNWVRVQGDSGVFSQDYGGHLRRPVNASHGTWEIFGYNKNGYAGMNVYDPQGYNNNYMHESGNGGLYQQNGNGWVFYHSRGNACLGVMTSTTSSSYKLYVGGSIYAEGDIVAYSDRRKKENIVTVNNALDTVNKLRGVYYNRIDDDSKKRQIGVIAQEIQEVLPEVVTYAKDLDEYGVSYGNITGLLIEAIKEQQAQIEELKELVNKLINK